MSSTPQAVNPSAPVPVFDMKSFMDLISKTEDKTKMTVLMEFFKKENLDFITELPTVQYTKQITKFLTYRDTMIEVLNLDDGMRFNPDTKVWDYHPELDDTDYIINQMVKWFKTSMVSHKRRNALAIFNTLRNDDAQTNIFTQENKGLRKFFGMK